MLVGHAGRCSFLHEMFGEEEPAIMKLVDSSRRPAGVVRCLFGACSFTDPCSSCSSGSAPRPDGFNQPDWGHRNRQKEGVHNVHTFGFGPGRVMSRDMGDGFVSGDR